MNLFRSEEHVKNWSSYDPISEEAIMSLADWAMVLGGPHTRNRMDPDYLSRDDEYLADFSRRLTKLGKKGWVWQSY